MFPLDLKGGGASRPSSPTASSSSKREVLSSKRKSLSICTSRRTTVSTRTLPTVALEVVKVGVAGSVAILGAIREGAGERIVAASHTKQVVCIILCCV